MNITIIVVMMIIVIAVLAFVTLTLIIAKNMTFDDVVDDVANQTKIAVNQSSRVVSQILEGGS